MIPIPDTNQINQAVAMAQDIKAQAQTNWPAICALAALAARELRNLNVWLFQAAEFVIKHGGLSCLAWKLVWNPTATITSTTPPKPTP